MSKLTSKLQVSVPKALADRMGLKPGDDLRWEARGDVLRAVPVRSMSKGAAAVVERLRAFDAAGARQARRSIEASTPLRSSAPVDRGWTREGLYDA